MPRDRLAAAGAGFSWLDASGPREPGPLVPRPHRVVERRREGPDVVTLALDPAPSPVRRWRPGQFNMLTAYGVGEAAISLSGDPDGSVWLEHTVRDVGSVSGALCRAPVGSLVGVRGPFGTDWGLDDLVRGPGLTRDVVVMAGGIGLAPLRGAVECLVRRPGPGSVSVLVGARSPDLILYPDDLARWARAGGHVAVTVDTAPADWRGRVGVVTGLVADASFDPAGAVALVCGPEVMIRFSARALTDRGVDPRSIRISLERSMQCGLGWCGHCQLGSLLVCRDGPVVSYGGVVETLLGQRER